MSLPCCRWERSTYATLPVVKPRMWDTPFPEYIAMPVVKPKMWATHVHKDSSELGPPRPHGGRHVAMHAPELAKSEYKGLRVLGELAFKTEPHAGPWIRHGVRLKVSERLVSWPITGYKVLRALGELALIPNH